jgi:2-methylisocitrate lyase-like PEP mutase family enzyme
MRAMATRLRELLGGDGMVLAPFVYDGLQAKIAEAAGFEAAYMTGFGTAAARGRPDVGLLTMNEMVENARTIAGCIEIPVICDADTGYGSPINVRRTVREFEAAGAAGLHIEDQVWPKRCGFFAGKQVIPPEEMVAKLRAARDAPRCSDFTIIARTDALQPNGWDDVERRARAYVEAGADLVFVDGIRSIEDLDTYARRLGDLPLLYNGQLETAADVEARGFRLMIHPATLAVAYRGMRDALAELRATGQVRSAQDPAVFADLVRLLGLPEALEFAEKYAE